MCCVGRADDPVPCRLIPFPSMKLLLLVLAFPFLKAEVEDLVSVVHTPADCRFTVHKEGPQGEEVTGIDLDAEIYYSIKCQPRKGYCLKVANCTVNADDGSVDPFTVIDENGCSNDVSIFGHVKYESDFTAGIANPFPIRFRSSSAAVVFYCQTTLEASDGSCSRKPCPP